MVLSEPKFQVLHGILHDVFSKEELKDTGIVQVQYFPCKLLAFHINSLYLQSCARVMLFHEDILSSRMTGDLNIIIDNCYVAFSQWQLLVVGILKKHQ